MNAGSLIDSGMNFTQIMDVITQVYYTGSELMSMQHKNNKEMQAITFANQMKIINGYKELEVMKK